MFFERLLRVVMFKTEDNDQFKYLLSNYFARGNLVDLMTLNDDLITVIRDETIAV